MVIQVWDCFSYAFLKSDVDSSKLFFELSNGRAAFCFGIG